MSAQTTLRFADARLRTGVRLRYAEQGDARSRAVIMLHGYTDSWFSYSRILPRLDTSLRAVVLDQRGHGDSERPAGGYTFSDYAADVVALMDELGIDRATVVGHSMGSHVAQRVALAAPERVEGLVLVGSATTIRNEAVMELERAVMALREPVPAEFAREFQESTVSVPLPDAFMARVVAESLKLPARVWRAAVAGMLAEPGPAAIERILAPTLVLWGEHDQFFPRTEQELLAARIPNVSLKIYAGVGHTPHWELPHEFTRDLEEFVAACAARRSGVAGVLAGAGVPAL